ncbi:YetF domain-containing protein [Desulforudis sp. DRI-14]|uniref:YetF domain-containing protein n=1 Tax=Desulforudis sp. DRI-14 TaxID=3459793 RepID=UPI0040425B6C
MELTIKDGFFMLLVLVRTIILFAAVVLVLRLTGKREVGQLQPFELVVIIMLSELASIPIADTDLPLINGLVPIFTLLVAQVLLSYASLKSERARGIICGRPSILIANGKIMEKEMSSIRYNINDLLEQLRAKNVPNIADVEFAILETNGKLSVIPKSQKRPVCPEDLNIPTSYEGLPTTLIIDGNVLEKNLKQINVDTGWLRSELAKFGIQDLKRVLFASLDTNGKLFYQVKS